MKTTERIQKGNRTLTRLGWSVFSITAVILMSFSNVQGFDDAELEEKKMGKEIVQMIAYPEAMMAENKTDNGIVILSFFLTPSGTISVIKVEGDDLWLNNYVSGALDGKHLSNYPEYESKKYNVPIQFKIVKQDKN